MPHRREALQALNARPGERILDLACGGGPNLPPIARVLGPGGRLVGLDYTPAMLAGAAARLRSERLQGVPLARGDAAGLPFPDAAFDAVLCTYALRVMPPWREALDEAVRVLRPGGRMVVLDGKPSTGRMRVLNPVARWIARGPLSDLRRPLVEELRARFADLRVSEYDGGHIFVAVGHKGVRGTGDRFDMIGRMERTRYPNPYDPVHPVSRSMG
jgi:demethylmenaquinone methyltransferase/2-methoxy-6-polyprenyl-1,4-benzoquinol methylase